MENFSIVQILGTRHLVGVCELSHEVLFEKGYLGGWEIFYVDLFLETFLLPISFWARTTEKTE